jgi:hypothetical protein
MGKNKNIEEADEMIFWEGWKKVEDLDESFLPAKNVKFISQVQNHWPIPILLYKFFPLFWQNILAIKNVLLVIENDYH